MVFWEITVVTAYFLGLKRTYKLALRIQRRLIPSDRPRIRQFLQSKTRSIFDMALKVHRTIQERDIQVGRSVGNWMLRFLDKCKPSANISGTTKMLTPPKNANMERITKNGTQNNGVPRSSGVSSEKGSSDRHLFSATQNAWRRSFPTITMMTQPSRVAGTSPSTTRTTQSRHLSFYNPEVWGSSREGDKFVTHVRPDILMWMNRK